MIILFALYHLLGQNYRTKAYYHQNIMPALVALEFYNFYDTEMFI